MDHSLPGSSTHRILQARILEWVAISFSRGSSQPRDQTWVSCIAAKFFTVWATRQAPFLAIRNYYWKFPVHMSALVLLFWKLSPNPTPTLSYKFSFSSKILVETYFSVLLTLWYLLPMSNISVHILTFGTSLIFSVAAHFLEYIVLNWMQAA